MKKKNIRGIKTTVGKSGNANEVKKERLCSYFEYFEAGTLGSLGYEVATEPVREAASAMSPVRNRSKMPRTSDAIKLALPMLADL